MANQDNEYISIFRYKDCKMNDDEMELWNDENDWEDSF